MKLMYIALACCTEDSCKAVRLVIAKQHHAKTAPYHVCFAGPDMQLQYAHIDRREVTDLGFASDVAFLHIRQLALTRHTLGVYVVLIFTGSIYKRRQPQAGALGKAKSLDAYATRATRREQICAFEQALTLALTWANLTRYG